MKNLIKTFSVALVLCCAAMTFTSCDEDQWWDEYDLVGSWYTVSEDQTLVTVVDFYDDNRGEIAQYENGITVTDETFVWQANSRHIWMDMDTDGSTMEWYYRFVDHSTFRVTTDNGDYAYFYPNHDMHLLSKKKN